MKRTRRRGGGAVPWSSSRRMGMESSGGRSPDSRIILERRLPRVVPSGLMPLSSPLTVAGAVSDSHRLPRLPKGSPSTLAAPSKGATRSSYQNRTCGATRAPGGASNSGIAAKLNEPATRFAGNAGSAVVVADDLVVAHPLRGDPVLRACQLILKPYEVLARSQLGVVLHDHEQARSALSRALFAAIVSADSERRPCARGRRRSR